MKPAGSPFRDCIPSIHGRMPSDFESFHECFEKLEVDDIILDNEDVDRRHSPIEKTGWEFRMFDEFPGSSVRSFGSRR